MYAQSTATVISGRHERTKNKTIDQKHNATKSEMSNSTLHNWSLSAKENSTVHSAPPLRSDPLFEASVLIWRICPPFIFLFGAFGNLMTLLVMRRLRSTGSTMNVFFEALAVSDLIVLCLDTLPKWLSNVFGTTSIEDFHSVTCKLYKVLLYATGVLSPWLLVVLTLQRAASVLWPHRVNAVWTKRKSRILVTAMTVFIVLLHIHYLYGFEIVDSCKNNILKCCPGKSDWYHWFHTIVWPWVDLLEFSLLPFCLLVISNTILVWKLLAFTREARRSLTTGQSAEAGQDSRDKKVSSLTVTLVTLSISFLILTTPLSIYLIIRPYVLTPSLFMKDITLTGIFDVFWAMGNIMWYTNSAVNFYLYCLTGTRFRAEFKAIMNALFYFRQAATETTTWGKRVVSLTTTSSTVLSTTDQNPERGTSDNTEADF